MSGAPHLERSGAVATLTLQRPAQRNRLHVEDLQALQSHFATLAADPAVRVLVLAATGPVFCAGFNLGELEGGEQAPGPQLFERTVDALEALPQITVARLHGGVHGGATDLALACDFRVGVSAMTLRMPAARIGLHYYAGGLRRFVHKLGPGAARRLFLLAEEVPADDLLRIGYLDRLVEADALDAAVDAIVQSLLAQAPLALLGMKASIDEIGRGEPDLDRLRRREADCAASADLREGLAALAARRAPRFEGR